MGRSFENRKHSIMKTAGQKSKLYARYGKQLYVVAKNGVPDPAGNPALRDFRSALEDMTRELALMIARDGAKSGRLLTCDVVGAESARGARNIGRSIVDSTLVRVGIAGAEPRAGRIVMAVGKAGEKADRDRLGIAIGDVAIAEGGETLSGFDADTVVRHLKSDRVQISVDIGIGRGKARVWAAL